MQLNAIRIKPKRERGHNWSTKEKIILFECVKDYLHIVSDCRNAVEVRKKKNLTWAWIAKLSKEMGVFVTETLKIKTQWKRMRIAAKKNIHAYQNGLPIDGKLVVPSELDWNVYNAITSICVSKRRAKSTDDDTISISNDVKHEIPADLAYDNMSNTVQIPDDIYSIEDESVSSHSNISLGSQTSIVESTSQETKTFHESDYAKSNANSFQKVSTELDCIYNAITNVCGGKQSKTPDKMMESLKPSEIKNEQIDDYAFNNMSSTTQIRDVTPPPSKSSATQTMNFEWNQCQRVDNVLKDGQCDCIPQHHNKILAVQLKIEEAKLKEIEERIHQQRVIFELNKTLLQKQIENESVKKYM